MTLAPILAAPLPVQLHVAAAILAIALAPFQVILPKGTPPHRIIGWTFAVSMIVVCLSAFLILDNPVPPRVFGLSWLHLLAIFTLFMIFRGISAARRGHVQKHRRAMLGLVFGALLFPAIFAFAVPGRIMHQVLFGH
jgi:uncharacterized membrane protein